MNSENPLVIDIIILSYAKNDELKKLTEQTISTCVESEEQKEIKFNIVVIESNQNLKPYQFEHSETIYPDVKFGFHRYLNIGIKNTNNEYICLCNNDLLFHPNWASEILKAMKDDSELLSASTFCPIMHKNGKFKMNSGLIDGYETLFSGWCFMVKRSLFDTIGFLDEKFEFWYADADYLKTLKMHGIKNTLITSSIVSHLNAVTSQSLSKKEYFRYTRLPQLYFNYKWKRDSYLKYKTKLFYFKFKHLLSLK
ncbi:glycosyltransferase family 2 protein [Pedobacter changchengzhani]|uniref:Glycosyltransferase family 2 protein n=1 Tax=Pedobacter changchengzhani TaxID=2529274 RepID=A0A4R5MI85_9SPHI|nr:glycosyltransferase [Pedobacter changchengzhani]TDG35300.1 glycosyltransferase family 2 protein [Pedobacter changchengzhani]